MITIETPLKAVHTQRRGLELLLVTRADEREFLLGALAVLDWLEHGLPSPLEQMCSVTHAAIQEDMDG